MRSALIFYLLTGLLTASCESSKIQVEQIKDTRSIEIKNLEVSNIVENRESTIELLYNDNKGLKASKCSITKLSEVSVSTPCSCDQNGKCTVGIQGLPNYTGSASFDYQIETAKSISNTSTVSFSIQPSIPFVSLWRTTLPNEEVTLPLKDGFKYNFKVDWGDGSEVSFVKSSTDSNKSHTYSNPGDYTITISGLAQAWNFNYSGSRNNIISVTEFGNLGWKDLTGAFSGCRNLESFSGGNAQEVTSASSMFYKADRLSTVDLSSWETPAITDLRGMFYEATNLATLDISNFNTSLVTDMSRMFYKVNSITELDLSHFDTSKVQDMTLMFLATTSLVSLDISNFNTESVTSMSNMFNSASALRSLDLSHFDTSKVKNIDMMFLYTKDLTSLNVNGWEISNIETSTDLFKDSNSALTINCDQLSNIFFGETCI